MNDIWHDKSDEPSSVYKSSRHRL